MADINSSVDGSKIIDRIESSKYIHDRGYGLSGDGSSVIDAEDFFIRLRDAVISEYTEFGYCEIVDEYIYSRPNKVDMLVYSAIAQVFRSDRYQKGSGKYVPLKDGRQVLTWEMANNQKIAAEVDSNVFLNDMMMINAEGRKLHKDYLKKIANVNPGDDFKEQLLEYQKKYRADCEQEIAALLDRNKETLYKTEQFHDQMCAKTNEFQVAWTKSLASVLDEMSVIKEEFYKHLHNWQKGLYPHEFEELAERYIELYKIIDVDKLIVDEVMKKFSQPSTIGMHIASLLGKRKESEEMIKLQKLDSTLHIFLRKFEVSLNGLGLYVYRAEEGAPFDYVWHTNVDDSIDCDGKTVKKCVVPGIARRVIGYGEDDVIIPALVSV